MKQKENVKVLDYIELTFENVDFAKIDAKNVESLYVDNIKHSCELGDDGVISDEYYCDSISLCIKYKECNNESTFALDQDGTKLNLADRLQRCRDVTHITLHYKSGREADFIVPWNFRSEYVNEDMVVHIEEKLNKESILISNNEEKLKYFSSFMI